MSPDFSTSAEHVALAKVMFEAVYVPSLWDSRADLRDMALYMADAAITHLGTGIPEANEANAERLARAKYDIDYPRLEWFFDTSDEQRRVRVGDAVRYLRALHAMMAEKPELERCSSHRSYNGCELKDGHDGPHKAGGLTWPAEKPEPAFDGAQGPDAEEERCGRCGGQGPVTQWRGLTMCDECLEGEVQPLDVVSPTVAENATVPRDPATESALESLGEGPGPDFAIEAAERERLRLIEAFMLRLAGNPAVMAKAMEVSGDYGQVAASLGLMAHAFAKEIA